MRPTIVLVFVGCAVLAGCLGAPSGSPSADTDRPPAPSVREPVSVA